MSMIFGLFHTQIFARIIHKIIKMYSMSMLIVTMLTKIIVITKINGGQKTVYMNIIEDNL